MTKRFSYITANLVAQPLGFEIPDGWQQGDQASNKAFAPLSSFEQRFGAMLALVKESGFESIDLWAAHLHWTWATLEHVEIAKRLLSKHGLVVRSYSAWVPGDESDLRGACRLCRSLGVSYIAGHIELVATDRSAAVEILRSFAVGYAIENHTETSIEQLLARLGDGDEDVIGIALDTGWCGTREWDAIEGLKSFYERIFVVHLKDVKAKRSEPSGYQFIDWGHETCVLGEGIVPVEAVLKELRRRGFRGPIGLEHEPETYDPTEEIKENLARSKRWWQEARPHVEDALAVVVVGCGNIANSYGEALRGRPEIRILGASDIDATRAEAWTSIHGGRVYKTLEEVLADPEVEAIVNLTIQKAHVEVVTKALQAGKHVHSEKPLAPTYAEAKVLVDLAAEKGLRLSCAPATWLGEAQQTAWRLVSEGRIGTPRVAYVSVDWARIERWHPNPKPFYDVGPLADVGVYPLTLLTAWFGPVRSVLADGALLLPERKSSDGKAFSVSEDNWQTLALEFACGLKARLTASFYAGGEEELKPSLQVFGDKGALRTQWFAANALVEVGEEGGSGYRPILSDQQSLGLGYWYCDWSAGVYGLWKGLRSGKPQPTSGAHAAHVVEIVEATREAVRLRKAVAVKSSFPPVQVGNLKTRLTLE